ncbi:MAG: histidine--tRNA ligase [Candidatus Omnitrophica bacterium]|nr:histidine--tRNA ligase [Candidatus Omnitrophota bacterium]MCF7892145.1 histidine--tRNA ligase [Candidatus Omnitrophota bacterium]MCF7897506.1 histidine--tRNA ligase [Candidatus Omnitrophota bacterium]MCF7909069.1 histidine--tRNA ligase [Candidatus Omnitrophota bacterium]
MKRQYSNVRGTVDFSSQQVSLYESLRRKSMNLFNLYGYRQLMLPFLEEKNLFIKGVGQASEIVQSQMMKIEGKDIVLRPEGTAQVVRYYLQHRLDKKNNFYKFFYLGPMFRGERPQRGRLRQFNHIGAEVVGSDSVYLDAEIIILALKIVDSIGLKKKQLQLNSLGCQADKKKLSQYIKEKLSKQKDKLCSACQKRIVNNPLRVIDCKRDKCKRIVNSLKLGKGHLCFDCQNHFNNLLNVLGDLGINYKYNPFLVRGLDYYTHTVFEITSDQLGSQDALGAGGRYNNLFSQLGGVDIPAVGFALGVERVMLALGKKEQKKRSLVFIARAGKNLEKQGLLLLSELRANRIASSCDFRAKSLKAQLRYGQKIGAELVVILGEDELKENKVILKDMSKSEQETLKLKDLTTKIKEKLKNYD